MAVDHDDQTSEGYVLNIIDRSIKDADIQVVLADQVCNDRLVCDVPAEGKADDCLIVFLFFVFMDIHMGQLLRNFRGHDGSDKFLQRFSLGIREEDRQSNPVQ